MSDILYQWFIQINPILIRLLLILADNKCINEFDHICRGKSQLWAQEQFINLAQHLEGYGYEYFKVHENDTLSNGDMVDNV